MKRFIYSLIGLAISACALAQPNPDDFFISGYVTDPNTGNAVSGNTVCVYSDTSNQNNVVFYQCTTTNSNGYYAINVPNGSVTGPNVTYIVYTWDCQNHYMDTTVINGQGTINSANVNFAACDSNSTYCLADFVWNHGFAGGVFFTYTGSNNATSYHWDFGDGATSALQDPSHTYPNTGGPWVATLTIATASGCSSTAFDTIWSNGSTGNCNASFTYSTTPVGGVAFNYNGTNNPNQTYSWSFGDGSSSSQQNPTHFYNSNGPWIVCLTINDSSGCSSTFCDTVGSNSQPTCSADFTMQIDSSNGVYVVTLQSTSIGTGPISYNWWVDGSQYSGSSVVHTFPNHGIYGICLDITTADSCYSYLCDTLYLNTGSGNNCNANFQYSLSSSGTVQFYSSGNNNWVYSWDFGDNHASTVPNPVHQYNAPGTYMVCLTVGDPATGCSATYCDTITVGSGSGNNCHANFYAVPDSITLPPQTSNSIFFYDNSTGTPSYWHWDFGDNTTSSQQNPVHTYNSPGTYYVCLTIANFGSNCTSTYCDTVVVGNGQTGPCLASFSYSLNPNGGVNFHGYANQNSVQYQWTFGDGSSGTGQNPHHVYSNPGTYTVCLTVYNNNGCQDTYCSQVSYGNNSSGFCIAGEVNAGTPNQRADYALVYLISYDSQTNTLTAIDTAMVDSAGYFAFCQVPGGQYLVKAALTPNSVYYANYMPTYYGNSLFWNHAQYVTASPVYPFITINLIAGNNPGGPGFVGGDVTQGANKTNGPGDPLESVQVLLLDMNDNPVTYAYTNAQGQFEFPNIAYGTYKVHPEVTGINTIPAIVTIDANTPSVSDIHLYQGTAEISTGIAQAITPELNASDIYPNPTADEAFITFELTKPADVNIRIYTATGQLVSDRMAQLGEGVQQVEINTDDLRGGIYFVQFTESEGLFNLNKQMILTK